MSRPFHYHVYHRPAFGALPPWASTVISIPGAGGVPESRTVYSLKKDMEQLRADGAAMGIVDSGVTSIGTTSEGREILALKVGLGMRHKVLFTGCHHAREWISAEIPYLVAEHLIRNYKPAPTTPQEKRIRHLLLNREIWFVPIANPDGHEYTTTVDRNWRPNRRTHAMTAATIPRNAADGGPVNYSAGSYTGVDINRNYATRNWGTETFHRGWPTTSRDPNDGGANSVWCGLSGSGEAESASIDALIRAQGFRASITYHSFSQLLLYANAAGADPYVQWVGQGMRHLINASGRRYTYQSGSSLYATSGDLMDFSNERAPGRPTFTPELRPADGTDPWPLGWGFSGLPESQIEPTFRENLGAALALINCAGHDTETSNHTITVATGSPATKCQLVRHAWRVFDRWTP